VGNFTLEDTVLRTNIEAAAEIARQLRLRDIGGIIIVDFIDMKSHSDMEIVVEKLISAFKGDRNKPIVVDVTKLGLVEVVRKKNRPTLDNKVSITCPTCGGKGKVRKNEA
jgi:ribonuclease G